MQNLRKFRKAKGLNQDQLAEIVGVSASAISQYENGHKTPSFETALKLAEALDCELADLVSERENVIPGENKKAATNDGDGDELNEYANSIFRKLSIEDRIYLIGQMQEKLRTRSNPDAQ